MQRVVVDAGTVLSWFDREGPGLEMRREYEAGAFAAVAPRRLHEDLLVQIARRTGWPADRLARIAAQLPHLGIQLQEPPLPVLARWLARGLDPEVAAYASLAESLDLRLAAHDPRLNATAGSSADR